MSVLFKTEITYQRHYSQNECIARHIICSNNPCLGLGKRATVMKPEIEQNTILINLMSFFKSFVNKTTLQDSYSNPRLESSQQDQA